MRKVDVVFAKYGRFHKVDVLCVKFCIKKVENWQVNFDIKTVSYAMLCDCGLR